MIKAFSRTDPKEDEGWRLGDGLNVEVLLQWRRDIHGIRVFAMNDFLNTYSIVHIQSHLCWESCHEVSGTDGGILPTEDQRESHQTCFGGLWDRAWWDRTTQRM